MKKIMLCSPYGGVSGGITRWAEHIFKFYNDLDNKRVELLILPMDRSSFVSSHSSVIYRLKIGIKDFTKILKNYFKTLKTFKPEVIHIASSASISLLKDLYMLKYAHRRKALTIIHFHFGRIPDLAKQRNWEWYLLSKVINTADYAIVIDKPSYSTLENSGFRNIILLPNPISPTVLNFIEKNKSIKRESRRLLYVGNVIRSKGVFELIEAGLLLKDIKIRIVGKMMPGIIDELVKTAKTEFDNSWIEMTGELTHEEVIKEMLSAGVFILPSYSEGFPNVILESMACACPIIATNVGAIPEMLGEDAGVLVEPKNSLMLSQKISFLLANSALALKQGQNAKGKVLRDYSMESVFNKLCDIWLSE